jgi:hypothetical protein
MVVKTFRPPGKEFERIEYSWDGGRRAATVFEGQTATLVGWIPFHPDQARLPEGFLRERYPRELNIRLLLGSGNNPPPERFKSGRNDLLRYVASRDFRGAIAIDAPILHVDANGKPVKFEFDVIARVGTTPMRGNQLPLAPDSAVWLSDGVSGALGEVEAEGKRVLIRVFLRLKLGLAGQIIGKITTRHWPPWATLSIDYAFDTEARVADISFAGTAVPSQRRYVGWEVCSSYEMDYDMGEASFDGFVQAGGCQDALARRTSVKSELKEVKIGAE